jgi:hypothetical protein
MNRFAHSVFTTCPPGLVWPLPSDGQIVETTKIQARGQQVVRETRANVRGRETLIEALVG